mmetsp:Transcript_6909/g.10496  ORF Transcript_6909/g.10496 Transcript_6909/m.10496 type:complete len:186 (-) Transcript_6909:105-662(-)
MLSLPYDCAIAFRAVMDTKLEEHHEVSDNSNIKCKTRNRQDLTKCVKCKTRLSRRGCTENACLQCCDNENCEAHAESREKAKYNDDLLKRNTDIARRAKRQRSLALRPGSFKEVGFSFTEQSIKIWDIHEFMSNQKWKDDAVRRSKKRKARQKAEGSRLKISRTRFHALIDDCYHRSLGERTRPK